MTAAWIALAVIAVGLPLLAWWIGSRGAWSRMEARGRAAGQAHRELIARHGLSSSDVEDVQRAVSQGRELSDQRLRAAAVDWAGAALSDMDSGRFGVLRTRAGTAGVACALVVLLVVSLVLSLASDDVRWSQWLVLGVNGLNCTLLVLRPFLTRRNLQRAVQLNGG